MNDQKAKSDAGKPKLSLVPRRIIFDIARIREYGNEKYPEGGIDNWKQVEPERYRDAAFRHFLAYLDDPYGLDAESGLPHLWHLATNVSFLCDLEDPKILNMTRERQIGEVAHGDVIGHKIRENEDGSVTFKVTKGGQETIDKLLDKTSKNKFDNDVVEEEPSKTIPGATIQKYSDGKLNMQLSESTMNLYKDLHVEHMEPEPGWTNWMKAWRDTDGEAEYYRIELLTDKVQYGDFDFESCEIVPRKN